MPKNSASLAKLTKTIKRKQNDENPDLQENEKASISQPAKKSKLLKATSLSNPDTKILIELEEKFLCKQPEELLEFWNWAKELSPKDPTKAFYEVNKLRLVGVFDYLDGKFEHKPISDQQFLVHYRFSTDLPEFQTLMVYESGRFGYWRDVPEEDEPLLVHIPNPSDHFPKLEVAGNSNLLSALYFLLKYKAKEPAYSKFFPDTADLFGFEDLILKAQVKRKKKIVGKAMHGAGIWVPVKNDVGYRPVTNNIASFRKDLVTMGTTQDEAIKQKVRSKIMETFAYIQMGNDELDYGMGLEFGHDLFISGYECFDRMSKNVLSTSYRLLKRDKFVKILDAQMEIGRHRENVSVLE